MKKTLVTAIYHYSPYSRMGGRNYTFEFYEAPFRNIINLNCNIVVYTHEQEKSKIESFFTKYNFTDYKIILFELDLYSNSDKIYEIKENNGTINENGLVSGLSEMINDRNNHLCLSKPYFLNDTIENKYFDSEQYFWIDAGLFHHGIIPETYGGIERYIKVNENDYWPIKQENVCNPNTIDKLLEKNNSCMIFMGNDEYPRVRFWEKYCEENNITHIVGGLFGGDKEVVKELYTDFTYLSTRILNDGILILEEEILSMLFSMKYKKYNYLPFKTWYHDIPTDKNYFEIKPGAESFYKIFL